MKTSEFIKIMESLGYSVEINNDVICLILDDVVMTIHEDEFGAIDTQWSEFTELNQHEQEKILEVAFKYIMTPLEEREEPKKYYLKLPNLVDKFVGYLNYYERVGKYMFGDKTGTIALKTQFTQEEIEDLPEQNFVKELIKEEVKC